MAVGRARMVALMTAGAVPESASCATFAAAADSRHRGFVRLYGRMPDAVPRFAAPLLISAGMLPILLGTDS